MTRLRLIPTIKSPRSILINARAAARVSRFAPKHVLVMQPVDLPVRVLCRAAEEGVLVSDNCRIGCIGCEICAETCKFDVITMKDHLPQFDYSKCTSCMMCAEVCPTSAIWADFDHRKIAKINPNECIGLHDL